MKKSFWKDEKKDENLPQIKDENMLQIKDENQPQVKDEGVSMDVDSAGLKSVSSRKVEEVGRVDPVADFEALLARRDSPEWVGKAIQGMEKVIIDLLDSAHYEKALTCLAALRSGCVIHGVLNI